jgi:2-oxoglutarate ferredoxin oxidoreductase subunit beta
VIELNHGEPIRFGAAGEQGVIRNADGELEIVAVADVGEAALLRHDAHREDPSLAFALGRLGGGGGATPIGIFRAAPRPSATAKLAAELRSAHEGFGDDALAALLHGGDTWSVGA